MHPSSCLTVSLKSDGRRDPVPFFEPLFKNRKAYFGRRMHHKVIVVDNRHALVGGINISNHYNDLPGQKGWLDFAIYIEGDIAKNLCGLCKKTWEGYMPAERISPCKNPTVPFVIKSADDCQLRMRRNDWVMRKSEISKSYLEMFRKANHQIIMMSGYFLPGRMIRKHLKMALARGVKLSSSWRVYLMFPSPNMQNGISIAGFFETISNSMNIHQCSSRKGIRLRWTMGHHRFVQYKRYQCLCQCGIKY